MIDKMHNKQNFQKKNYRMIMIHVLSAVSDFNAIYTDVQLLSQIAYDNIKVNSFLPIQ